MLLTLFLISVRSCDFFSLPPGKEEKAQGFVQNLDIRWSGLSLTDLCWCQQRSNRNVFSHVFLSCLCRVVLNEHSVLHSAAECCSGLSLTLPCPIVSLLQWILVSVPSWTGRWAGETPSLERLTGWPPRSSPATKILTPLTTSRYPHELLSFLLRNSEYQCRKTHWQAAQAPPAFWLWDFGMPVQVQAEALLCCSRIQIYCRSFSLCGERCQTQASYLLPCFLVLCV